jgi:hypothetical protein
MQGKISGWLELVMDEAFETQPPKLAQDGTRKPDRKNHRILFLTSLGKSRLPKPLKNIETHNPAGNTNARKDVRQPKSQ